MDDLGVIGCTHRKSGLGALERLSTVVTALANDIQGLSRDLQVAEFLLLNTCNRIELVFACEPGVQVADVRSRLIDILSDHGLERDQHVKDWRAWSGAGAVEHVFLVASGMDSARLGENEIRAQIRSAIDKATAVGVFGPQLKRLFDHALKLSRQIHGDVVYGTKPRSIADIAVQEINTHVADTSRSIALIGVSPMNKVCFERLLAAGHKVTVANRTRDNAECLVQGRNATAVSLEDFFTNPPELDAVTIAISKQAPPFTRDQIERIAPRSSQKNLLLVDFGVPPNAPAHFPKESKVRRFGMEEIIARCESGRDEKLAALAPARIVIDHALDAFCEAEQIRAAGGAIGHLTSHYRMLAHDHTVAELSKSLVGLSDSEQNNLQCLTKSLANEFAHVPLKGLRALASVYGEEAVSIFMNAALEDRQNISAWELEGSAPNLYEQET